MNEEKRRSKGLRLPHCTIESRMFRFLLVMILLAWSIPAFAADSLIAQPEVDGYRLLVTAAQTPLVTGNLELDFTLVNASDGTPIPASGMRLFLTPQGFAAPPSETIALVASVEQPNQFRSNKLYVADAGSWNLRIEVLFVDGTRRDFNVPLIVNPVTAGIAATARIVLPVGLVAGIGLGAAWWVWRRRNQRAKP